MSDTAGHVARWDAYIEDTGAQPHISWIVDADGEMVTYEDHKKIVDTLAAQMWELAQMVMMLCEKHGHTDYPSYQLAQAVLDAQGSTG